MNDVLKGIAIRLFAFTAGAATLAAVAHLFT